MVWCRSYRAGDIWNGRYHLLAARVILHDYRLRLASIFQMPIWSPHLTSVEGPAFKKLVRSSGMVSMPNLAVEDMAEVLSLSKTYFHSLKEE